MARKLIVVSSQAAATQSSRSRWAAGVAFTMVLVLAFILLGRWQWQRREERLKRNAVISANYDRQPVPYADLADAPFNDHTQWTPFVAEGQYDADNTVLIRNRILNKKRGFRVLVPFKTTSGVVMIDRGWIPSADSADRPEFVPPPPPTTVRIVARIRPAEPLDGRNAPEGQAISITPIEWVTSIDSLRTDGFASLATENGSEPTTVELMPRPETSEGPHLSYALQWFAFAIMAVVGFGVVFRRRHDDIDPELAAATRAASRRRSRPTAEDEEDAMIDAQMRQRKS